MRGLLAAIQCQKGDLDTNLSSHLSLLASAASAGCDLAVFPEMSLTGSADPATHPDRLVALDHPAVTALTQATSAAGVAAVFGIAERDAGQAGSTADEDFPGLAALVGPDGGVTSRLPDWRPGTLVVDIPC